MASFGEAKIIDFRDVFDILPKHKFECSLDGQKIEKMELQMATTSSRRLSTERADPPREGKGRDYVIC